MQTLIKQIRSHLNMSQTELAERMNVTFATVNRWENGHALPNKLAQMRLHEICLEGSVPVYQFVLDRIQHTAESMALPAGRKLLYHGSKAGVEGRIEPNSRPQCDFGRGFYMGTEVEQALTLICDYDKSKLYMLSVDLTDLNVQEVPSDIHWAMLVAFHRGRMEKISDTPLYEKYRNLAKNKDLIIGSIANDRMFYVIDNFFIGNITDAALVNSLAALQLGKQYVAVTQKACDTVKIEAEIELSYLERLFIKEVAEENRAKGISLAGEICRNYRRKGLFFDEILDEARKGGA